MSVEPLSFVDRLRCCVVFFFQAEDGIRDLVRSRGLGDVYKRQSSLPVVATLGVRPLGAGLLATVALAITVVAVQGPSLIHI